MQTVENNIEYLNFKLKILREKFPYYTNTELIELLKTLELLDIRDDIGVSLREINMKLERVRRPKMYKIRRLR